MNAVICYTNCAESSSKGIQYCGSNLALTEVKSSSQRQCGMLGDHASQLYWRLPPDAIFVHESSLCMPESIR